MTTEETTTGRCPVTGPPFPYARTGPFAEPAEYAQLVDGGISQVTLSGTGLRVWAVTGHDAVRRLLTDRRVSAARTHEKFPFYFVAPPQARTETSFIGYDDQEHSRSRQKVAAVFTRQRIKTLRPRIREVVDEHIDRMLAHGAPLDLHRTFSLSVPMTVICELLGVPQDDHDFLIEHSSNLFGGTSTPQQRAAAFTEVNAYVEKLVADREQYPGDDLISVVLDGHRRSGEEFGRRDVVNMIRMLMNGGHETTASMISLGLACLLSHPEQLAALRADPDGLIEPATEELLRLVSIGDVSVPRVALEDIEIDGTVIPAGDGILCLLLTANRDPEVFPEPDRLLLHRGSRRQLGFGHGAHHCIGAELARVELQICWTALLERLPDLRLTGGISDVRCKERAIVYGVHELSVSWGPATSVCSRASRATSGTATPQRSQPMAGELD